MKKKEEFKPYLVFDQEDAIGVPDRPYKRADFNDLSKGTTENEDIIYLGVGGGTSIPNPLVNYIIQASDGSLSNPGYAWATDTDTGFYWLSSGVFAVSINATKEVEFNSSGIAISDMTLGSVLFAGASGQITQDNSKFFWDNSNDRLGVGTNSPTRNLQSTKIGQPQLRLDATGGYYVDLECDGNADLYVYNASGLGQQLVLQGGDAGTDYRIRVNNTNTTSGTAGAVFYLQVASTAAGDCYHVYDIFGGTTWILGADNSDSDKYKITTAALSGFSGTKGVFFTSGIYTNFAPAVASSGTAYAVDLSGAINTGGSNGLFRVTNAASTGQTASTEINFVYFDLGATTTWAAGAITSQRAIYMEAPTLAFASASTVTTASTLYIDQAPQAGSNATLTNSYALWIGGGRHFLANGTNTIASAAGAVWNAVLLDMDVSVSGSTNITTATGFNMLTINAPTVTDVGTMGTITNSATVYIGGAPTASGLTITNAYALWVDDGAVRIDGALSAASFTVSGLTSGRVTFATTGGALTDDAGFTFDGTTLTLSDSNATTTPLAIFNQASTGDSAIRWSLATTISYAMGIDNSASDAFVISTAASGTAVLGTGNILSISSAGTATLAALVATSSITNNGLTSGRVTFASTSGLLADDAGFTFDGVTLTLSDSNAATTPLHIVNQASTGDSAIRFSLATTASYAVGIDNSDSDKFKISYAASGTAVLGTGDYLTIGTDGEVITPQWLQVGTATDPAAQGDFVAGLTGAGRLFYDQSVPILYLYNSSGTIVNQFSAVASTNTIFNEQGADIDFRIESVNVPNLMIVEAGNNSISFGDVAPGTNTFFNIIQPARTTGSPGAFNLDGGAHTTLTASVEAIDFHLRLNRTVEFSAGALATQRACSVKPPTYAFTSASTITAAITFEINGAPSAGANCTITNAWALVVGGTQSRFDGNLRVGGTAAPSAALDVTGTIASSGDVAFGTSVNSSYRLTVSDNATNSRDRFENTASSSTSNDMGFEFYLNDSGANLDLFGAMLVSSSGATSGSEQTTFSFLTFSAGSLVTPHVIQGLNSGFGNNFTSFGSGIGVIGLADASTNPTTNPSGGHVYYSNSGVPTWRSSAGNVFALIKSSAYTPSNVTTDRTYDANSTSIDEIADVLGTLIADLQATGIIG